MQEAPLEPVYINFTCYKQEGPPGLAASPKPIANSKSMIFKRSKMSSTKYKNHSNTIARAIKNQTARAGRTISMPARIAVFFDSVTKACCFPGQGIK